MQSDTNTLVRGFQGVMVSMMGHDKSGYLDFPGGKQRRKMQGFQ